MLKSMQPSTSQDNPNPPKSFPQDFPPVPKCFLHLLNNTESDIEEHVDADSPSHNIIMRDHVDSKDGTSSLECNTKSGETESKTLSNNASPISHDQNVDCYHGLETDIPLRVNETKESGSDVDGKRKRQNQGKLNFSLSKLRREMTDLRSLDVSLFFQLISLHEAIQDFKLSVGDRFSETGSEYSLGSASYMGSMSSLSEEDSEWLEGVQSHSSAKSLEDSHVFENSQSASSLLDQITALVKKADADF